MNFPLGLIKYSELNWTDLDFSRISMTAALTQCPTLGVTEVPYSVFVSNILHYAAVCVMYSGCQVSLTGFTSVIFFKTIWNCTKLHFDFYTYFAIQKDTAGKYKAKYHIFDWVQRAVLSRIIFILLTRWLHELLQAFPLGYCKSNRLFSTEHRASKSKDVRAFLVSIKWVVFVYKR